MDDSDDDEDDGSMKFVNVRIPCMLVAKGEDVLGHDTVEGVCSSIIS